MESAHHRDRAAQRRRRGAPPPPFRLAGAWVGDDPSALTAASHAPVLRAASFGYVMPKLHHGVHDVPATKTELEAGWHLDWRNAGFGVIGWGYLDAGNAPDVIATKAVQLCTIYDLDGYVVDAEDECEGPGRWRLHPFLEAFRTLAPRSPLAVSGIGAAYDPWVRALDYPAVVELADAFMPQCYPNHDGLSVTDCMRHADRAGVPREIVVPTLGTWPGQHGYDPNVYVAEVDQAGTLGFNIFLASTAVPHDYDILGAAIRDRGIAHVL